MKILSNIEGRQAKRTLNTILLLTVEKQLRKKKCLPARHSFLFHFFVRFFHLYSIKLVSFFHLQLSTLDSIIFITFFFPVLKFPKSIRVSDCFFFSSDKGPEREEKRNEKNNNKRDEKSNFIFFITYKKRIVECMDVLDGIFFSPTFVFTFKLTTNTKLAFFRSIFHFFPLPLDTFSQIYKRRRV